MSKMKILIPAAAACALSLSLSCSSVYSIALVGMAGEGDVQAVQAALDAGSDPNTGDPILKMTPLYVAAANGHLEVVQVLLDAGADVNAMERFLTTTPLYAAAANGHLEVVQVLLDAGADVNVTERILDTTPLHGAAANGNLAVMLLLLAAGADVNATDRLIANTPLHEAAVNGNLAAMPFLLVAGADASLENKLGQTPLDILELRAVGPDANLGNKLGPTFLGMLELLAAAANNDEKEACPTPYARKDWLPHWVDADGDCMDTRHEVLASESKEPASGGCMILAGLWEDPYTGKHFTDPGQLKVDHVVPLAEAHKSGGHAWGMKKKHLYANFLEDPEHLIAVAAFANRSKGTQDPSEWLPSDADFHRAYAEIWTRIKVRWGLTADVAERGVLEHLLGPDAVLPEAAPECDPGAPMDRR